MRAKLISIIVLVTCALAIVKLFVYDLTSIHSTDMAPTLLPGDLLLANKLSMPPQRGDLVLFQPPDAQYLLVSRVIGLPGESFALKQENPTINGSAAKRRVIRQAHLILDGRGHTKPYAIPVRIVDEQTGKAVYVVLRDVARRSRDVATVTLRSNEYYVMSDNRNHGKDSRDFGPIPLERIRATITHRLAAGEPRIKPGAARESFVRLTRSGKELSHPPDLNR